jgi:hypothetical protein
MCPQKKIKNNNNNMIKINNIYINKNRRLQKSRVKVDNKLYTDCWCAWCGNSSETQ